MSDVFYFKKEDDFFEVYEIYSKGVNCSKGEEKKVGYIDLQHKPIKVNLTEIDLTFENFNKFLNAVRSKFKCNDYEEIRFV